MHPILYLNAVLIKCCFEMQFSHFSECLYCSFTDFSFYLILYKFSNSVPVDEGFVHNSINLSLDLRSSGSVPVYTSPLHLTYGRKRLYRCLPKALIISLYCSISSVLCIAELPTQGSQSLVWMFVSEPRGADGRSCCHSIRRSGIDQQATESLLPEK